MKLFDSLARKLDRMLDRMLDPVIQDPYAVLYGDYKGYTVRLIPVCDEADPGRIANWKHDPEQIAAVERKLEADAREAERKRLEAARQPQLPNASAQTAQQPVFNPACCAGL